MVFDPFAPTPVLKAPHHGRTYTPDTRHAVGNITARIRRDGTPRTFGEWKRLMAAPAGR